MAVVVLSDNERAALVEFCSRVRGRFGARVSRIALFGSRARGDVHAESDIDVCVAVDGLTWEERREIYGFSGDVWAEQDVLVSALVISTEHLDHLRRRERALAQDIDREGIPL